MRDASPATNASVANADLTSARDSRAGFILLVALGVYFALHFITRTLVSPNLQLDEAEQLIVTQDWRMGYGSQPPLYNWIQKAIFSVIGVNVFGLSLLKNLALWSAYAFTYLAAREILSNRRLAALATASLLFFPQIAWESQRDQSHLVLATTCAAATLWIYVRLLKAGAPGAYAALGLAAGLGFLAKYNYAVLPASLVCASFFSTNDRKRLLNWKIFIALLCFLIIAGPHLAWMLHNKTSVASQNYKFMATGLIAPKSPIAGILQLVKAFVAIAAVPLLIYSPFVTRHFKEKRTASETLLDLLTKSFISGVVLSLFVVVLFHVSYLRDRWVQPLMFALPILLVGLARDFLTDCHFRRLFGLSAIVATTVLVAINVTVVGANALNRSHNLNIPYAALASEFRKDGFDRGTIIANGFALGGNLRNQFRESRVFVPEMDESSAAQRPVLIAWSARNDEAPQDFLNYAAGVARMDRAELKPTFIEIPCQNGKRTSEKFGFVLLR